MNSPTALQLKCYRKPKNKILKRKKLWYSFLIILLFVENYFLMKSSYLSFGKDTIKLFLRSLKYSCNNIYMTNVIIWSHFLVIVFQIVKVFYKSKPNSPTHEVERFAQNSQKNSLDQFM